MQSSSALNVDFNGVRIGPLGSRSPPYQRGSQEFDLGGYKCLLVIAISICPGSRRQNNHVKKFNVD